MSSVVGSVGVSVVVDSVCVSVEAYSVGVMSVVVDPLGVSVVVDSVGVMSVVVD